MDIGEKNHRMMDKKTENFSFYLLKKGLMETTNIKNREAKKKAPKIWGVFSAPSFYFTFT
ncbi:MAG: hypothetical protein ACI32O_04895 [Enterococcus sp.]